MGTQRITHALQGHVPPHAHSHQAVDADTQKAMMAWYYKKQEQQKVGERGGRCAC